MLRSRKSHRRRAPRQGDTDAPEVASSDGQEASEVGSEEVESSSPEPAPADCAPRGGPAKAPGRIRVQTNGLIEDLGWTAADKRKPDEDRRSLKELAASVMASARNEPAPPPEGDVAGPEPPGQAESAPPEEAVDEPGERSETGSRARWAVLVIAGLLLFIGGSCLLRSGLDSGGAERDSGHSAAVDSAKDVGKPKPSPTPVAAPTSEAGAGDAAPAAAAPAPTPAAARAPGSAAAPTPAPSAHVGDLDGSAEQQGAKKTKLSVKVYVHDAGRSPVAGATVSGQWTGGGSGPASCVTGSDGACVVTSKPLDVGGSATFTVGGIDAYGLPYDPALNLDPDGDSDGTSITVKG